MTLYEITTDGEEESAEVVTMEEAVKKLKRRAGSLYGAAAEGRLIGGIYRIRVVDKKISEKRDGKLLAEYDVVRKQILALKRGQ